jgi:hypothetical protein
MAKTKDNDEFPTRWDKALPPGFKGTAESYSEDELKKCIIDANKEISVDEKNMDDDADLASAKEEVKTLALPYKESIKAAQAKARYCVYLLNQRGNA